MLVCYYLCLFCLIAWTIESRIESSNSFIWVSEGGDLGTADWGCLAGRCASLCLQAARGGRDESDESALEACACSRLTMRYTN